LPRSRSLVATRIVKTNDKITFMTLPAEIRLPTYDLLLVSCLDQKHPSYNVRNTLPNNTISLHMPQIPFYRTLEPQILQTCKQIYHEAGLILYSHNLFLISEPKKLFRLAAKFDPVNLKMIKTLDTWMPYVAKLIPWLQFLYKVN